MFAQLPLQPNEFQAQLRLASTAVSERATANKIQLPANFYLGFDEYATSLPNSEAAPRLGQQLRAIEWIANTIIEAHVDALNSLARTPLPQEKAGSSSTRAEAASRAARPPKTASTKEEDRRSNVNRRLVFVQPGRRATGLQPNRGGQRAVLHHPYARW